ncbi:MAG: tetratricopeptide repeat protein [Flavobacterium sp.]|nr:MAG: tetratricopeptide repeat protein [Flavobacterium sp.]
MKKLLLFLLFASASVFSQNAFEQGNAFYRNEKYKEAAQAYEQVLKSGKESAEVYFNLGNSYYKLNQVAPAIYNYEKALQLKPGDSDTKNNLVFAHKMMIDEVKEVPRVGFRKMISDFTSMFSYDRWAWIAVFLAVFSAAAFAVYYFAHRASYKRIFFIGMFAFIFLMCLSIASAAFERGRIRSERPAIVFSGIAAVKSEPRSSGGDVAVLHEGTKVYVQESLESWNRVTLPDGNDGWIESSAIRELK